MFAFPGIERFFSSSYIFLTSPVPAPSIPYNPHPWPAFTVPSGTLGARVGNISHPGLCAFAEEVEVGRFDWFTDLSLPPSPIFFLGPVVRPLSSSETVDGVGPLSVDVSCPCGILLVSVEVACVFIGCIVPLTFYGSSKFFPWP